MMHTNALRRTATAFRNRTLWRGTGTGTSSHSETLTTARPTCTCAIYDETNTNTNRYRGFSTSTSTSTSTSALVQTNPNPNPNGFVTRRGLGDDIVTVVVGDKEFRTLKSTLQVSPVIWDAVQRAEEQKEESSASTTIFLDRDPKHFPMILQYLRNKVEDVSYNREWKHCPPKDGSDDESKPKQKHSFPMKSHKHHTKYIRLPKDADPSDLQDLYLEATYYELDDLKIQLDHATFVVRAFQFLNGGPSATNPFETTKRLVTTLRNTSVGVAGVGTGAWAMLTDSTNSATTLALSVLGT